MKTMIHEVNEASGKTYQLFAETTKVNGYTHLKFFTVWDGAMDPAGTQDKFEAFLPEDAVQRLKLLLDEK